MAEKKMPKLTGLKKLDDLVENFIDRYPQIDIPKNFTTLLYFIGRQIEVDRTDIQDLDDLFSAYVLLCGIYNCPIMVNGFSCLINIPYSTVREWKTGRARNATHRDTVRRWFDVEETYLNKKTAEGSGLSFSLLKSKFEYKESPTAAAVTNVNNYSVPIPTRESLKKKQLEAVAVEVPVVS